MPTQPVYLTHIHTHKVFLCIHVCGNGLLCILRSRRKACLIPEGWQLMAVTDFGHGRSIYVIEQPCQMAHCESSFLNLCQQLQC